MVLTVTKKENVMKKSLISVVLAIGFLVGSSKAEGALPEDYCRDTITCYHIGMYHTFVEPSQVDAITAFKRSIVMDHQHGKKRIMEFNNSFDPVAMIRFVMDSLADKGLSASISDDVAKCTTAVQCHELGFYNIFIEPSHDKALSYMLKALRLDSMNGSRRIYPANMTFDPIGILVSFGVFRTDKTCDFSDPEIELDSISLEECFYSK